MTFSARQEAIALITVGVDTHLDVHVAVALDQLGRRLDILSLPTTETGYQRLVSWAERESLGELVRVGVEGTGSYGAGLARFLQSRGVEVVEVNRPKRKDRPHGSGKSATRSTLKRPPEQFWRALRPGDPKMATERLR